MYGNHIERVKIKIKDNNIDQITDFKYLGYCISEYKSDLEHKLQTYNKINGAIRNPFHYKLHCLLNVDKPIKNLRIVTLNCLSCIFSFLAAL